ncbi:endothelin-converting enzyme homolog [Planococcus citri]|uniref:endothelin-converting enzyme homolog n=1 Tax=Planococcus citri TaxID=170843 RepID=UPI0031F91546
MDRLSSTRFRRAFCWAIIFFVIISVSLLCWYLIARSQPQNAVKKICETKECLSAAQNLMKSIDFEANPCDDFYQYACGNWPKNHNNSDDNPGSTFTLRMTENEAELHDFLKKNNTEDEPEAVHKARELYALCLNPNAYSKSLEPIRAILQKIGLPLLPSPVNENKNFYYATALARASKLAGIKVYFDLTTDLNPYNRSLNMIALRKKAQTAELDPTMMPLIRTSGRSKREVSAQSDQRQFMIEVIGRMCEGINSTSCNEWTSVTKENERNKTIENMLTQINGIYQITKKPTPAQNSTPIVIYSLKQLQDLTDSIATEVRTTIPNKLNWTRYIEETYTGLDNVTLDLSDPTRVQIAIASFDSIKEIIRFIHETKNLKLLELGIWWEVVYNLLPYVDYNIFDKKVRLHHLEEGNIEKRCAEITRLSFGMAVSYAYATNERYTKAKTNILRMHNHIRDSLQQIIQEASWLDETTRQKALKKLQSMKSYIVYPSEIKGKNKLDDLYKNVNISENFYDTMIGKIQAQVNKTLSKLNRINDINEDDWIMKPTIVNAAYNPQDNAITIPAGILGSSIYTQSLRALDYGGIGTIVGHELTHAFDNKGRRFNEIGNLEDWWQADTLNSFEKKAECFVNAYANYSMDFERIVQRGDSKVTVGEDISDSGGFKQSLFAYRKTVSEFGEELKLPQFESFSHEQLFTLSFANLWCENPTESSAKLSLLNEHSPKGVRVNGVLKNSKEFAEIWKCSNGSRMNPTAEKCSLW